jgi:redox-sensing transcriptional repressor
MNSQARWLLTSVVKHVAESSVRRLSLYLRHLEEFHERGQMTVSSEELAHFGATTSSQVRKDLSFFGSFGKRGLGYSVPDLVERLRNILGIGRLWRIIIVGAGNIGTALAQYRGFRERGFHLAGIFDNSTARVGKTWDGVTVRSMTHFERDVRKAAPHIAIVTVPADAAQGVVDRLVDAGVRAILNFAPIAVQAPAGVLVRNVNMALELEGLAYALLHARERAS